MQVNPIHTYIDARKDNYILQTLSIIQIYWPVKYILIIRSVHTPY